MNQTERIGYVVLCGVVMLLGGLLGWVWVFVAGSVLLIAGIAVDVLQMLHKVGG